METQETLQKQPLKKGDIFYASWGYDQTQNDFLIIEEVSPTGKTVLCRMVGKNTTANGWNVYPTFKPYGVQFRLRVSEWHNKVTLRGSYPYVQQTYPMCKRLRAANGGSFECKEGIEEAHNYYRWAMDQRNVWCKGCSEHFQEDSVSKRKDFFSRYKDEPVYETADGYGH